jgi:TfoX/Sxy family transcriptional regulator of competence genes
MAFDEALAERIRQRLARRKNVEEKKMFGGVGFLLNGNLLNGVRKDSPTCGSARKRATRRCWSRTSRSSTSPAGR